MGWVADRFGLKRTFTTAIALRSLVALLMAFAVAPWQLFAIRALHGFSESLRDPSVNVLIAENARKKSLASAFAWYTTAKMSAGSIGKAIGGLLLALTFDNYQRVFLVAFILSALPLYVVARYLKEPQGQPREEGAAEPDEQTNDRPKRNSVLAIAVLGFLVASTAHMINSLFPVLAMEYAGLSSAQTSLIYLVSIVVVIAAGPIFGWLSDHISHKFVLVVRGVANTVSSILFYYFPIFAGLAAGNIVDAMGKAAFRPAWGALIARISSIDRKRRARTMSYLSLGEGLGETLGPMLGGFLWHTWGIGVMLGARVILAIIGEVYALVIARKTGKVAWESPPAKSPIAGSYTD
jgi:MFS family permease